MKKIYLMLLSAIFVGGLSAQSASIAEQANIQNQNKSKESNATLVQNQSTTPVGDIYSELPGFPVFVDTGNREKDCATFNESMERWMSNSDNKALYDKYLIKMGRREAAIDESNNKESK